MSYYFPISSEHIQKLAQEETSFVEKLIQKQKTLTQNTQALFPNIAKHLCPLVFFKYALKAPSSEIKEISFFYLSKQIKSLQYGNFITSFEYIHLLAISLMLQEQVGKTTSFDQDMYLAPSSLEHKTESLVTETLRHLVINEKEKVLKIYSKLEKK